MRTPKIVYWFLVLGFVLASGSGIKLDAQDNGMCTTTSRRETYYDHQGKVQFQKTEIKPSTPGLIVAQYSLTSRKLIKLTKFWKLRRKGYLACEEYYEKAETLEAEKKRSGPTSAKLRSAFK